MYHPRAKLWWQTDFRKYIHINMYILECMDLDSMSVFTPPQLFMNRVNKEVIKIFDDQESAIEVMRKITVPIGKLLYISGPYTEYPTVKNDTYQSMMVMSQSPVPNIPIEDSNCLEPTRAKLGAIRKTSVHLPEYRANEDSFSPTLRSCFSSF